MKKVAVFGQTYTVNADKEIKTLLKSLEDHKVVIFLEKNFYDALNEQQHLDKKYPTFSKFEDLNSSFDLFFSIGGDGTMLRTVTYVRDLNIPILGVNTGRLGFLANVNKEEIKESIDLLVAGDYTIQERTLLSVEMTPHVKEFEEFPFALNEVTIARKNTTTMIGVETYLNDEYLTNYWADGLIIATPTGSTGYSLSCNGPVVSPNSKNLVLTPIAPHNLNARPMVIPDDTVIQLKVDSREKDYQISLDSRIASVPRETKILIKKSPFSIKSVIPSNQSFLTTLRTKLLWGEDTRNESNL
jgi:NAD+ kinase